MEVGELGKALHDMHVRTRNNQARIARTERGKQAERVARQSLDLLLVAPPHPDMFERAKAFTINHGIQGAEGITPLTLDPDGFTHMKNGDAVFNPNTGQIVTRNRGSTIVPDGANILNPDGSLADENKTDIGPTALLQEYAAALASGFEKLNRAVERLKAHAGLPG